MGKIELGVFGVICIVGVFLYNQFQVNPLRNMIVFENDIEFVADSLAKMNRLLRKLPTTTNRVNYFMDKDGYLYLGAERVALLKGAINNPKVRNDMFLEEFTDKEIDQFFYLMAYLFRNNVDAANLEKPIGNFLFNYRRTDENTSNDLREIMIVRNSQDTLSSYFEETFQILDRKLNLVLLAPRNAQVR